MVPAFKGVFEREKGEGQEAGGGGLRGMEGWERYGPPATTLD